MAVSLPVSLPVSSPVPSPEPSPEHLIQSLEYITVNPTPKVLEPFNGQFTMTGPWAEAGGNVASPELRAALLAGVEALMAQLEAPKTQPAVLETLRILARNNIVKAHRPLLDALLAMPIGLSGRALFNMLGRQANRDLCMESPEFMQMFTMDPAAKESAPLEQVSSLLSRLFAGSNAVMRLGKIPSEYWRKFILAWCANRVPDGYTLFRNLTVQDFFVESLTQEQMSALITSILHEFEGNETPAFDDASALLHHFLCNIYGWAEFDKAGAFEVLKTFYMRVQRTPAQILLARVLRVLAMRYRYDKYTCPAFATNAREALSWLPEAVTHAATLTNGCKIGDKSVDRSQVVVCNKCRYCVTTELVYALKLYMSLTEKSGEDFKALCIALAGLFTRAIVGDLFRPYDVSRDQSGDDTTASRAAKLGAVSTEMPKGCFASAAWALGTNYVVDGDSYTVTLPQELIEALGVNLAKFREHLLISDLTVR